MPVTAADLLRLLVTRLEEAGIPYYLRDGGSEKHIRDVRSMLELSPEAIDRSLLTELIDRFRLREEWVRVARP